MIATKTVYIDTTEYCKEARVDAQQLINMLHAISNTGKPAFCIVNNIQEADIIIYYSCGHLYQQEVNSLNTIARIIKLKKPSSQLIVWGCMPKINPQAVKQVHHGLSVGPQDWDFFYQLFHLPLPMPPVNPITLIAQTVYPLAACQSSVLLYALFVLS